MEQLRTLKKQVEDVLTESPEARNSDKKLTWLIWQKFYGFRGFFNYEQFEAVPSQDSVKRIRAVIQNEEYRLFPTKWEVAKKRNINKERWEKYLGYNNLPMEQGELI